MPRSAKELGQHSSGLTCMHPAPHMQVNLTMTIGKAFHTLGSGFPCLSPEAQNQHFSTLGEVK